MRHPLALAALVVAAGFGPSITADAAESPWTVVELQPLHEGDEVRVGDINDAGISVGTSEPAGGDRAPVRWDADGVPTELELEDGCAASAVVSISNDGHITGSGVCDDLEDHFTALIWQPDGTPSHAGGLTHGESIDDNGVITGWDVHPGAGPDAPNTLHAFAYLQGHPQVDLAEAGADNSIAFGHTSWGYVVGALSGLPGLPTDVAVGWYGPYLFPLLDTDLSSAAVAVDESGTTLVVTYPDGSTRQRGHLVAPGGRTVALNSAGDFDRLADVNGGAVVVGTKTVDDKSTAAVADDDVVGTFYLGSLAVSFEDLVSDADVATYGLTFPTALNDSAWVVGADGGTGWLLRPSASAG
jgi:hypothetical protein